MLDWADRRSTAKNERHLKPRIRTAQLAQNSCCQQRRLTIEGRLLSLLHNSESHRRRRSVDGYCTSDVNPQGQHGYSVHILSLPQDFTTFVSNFQCMLNSVLYVVLQARLLPLIICVGGEGVW